MNKGSNNSSTKNNSAKIIEVYQDNFVSEIKKMSSLLDEYNYIGMDTEFPGVVNKIGSYSDDFYYKSIKINVDDLKLIQLGVTLCNSKGESPPDCTTWQFNFHFEIKKDKYSSDSINLLMNSGIKFDLLESKGISHKLFGEYFITSGLLLNHDIHWICYHGSYDFAYLLKIALGLQLPKTEAEFTSLLCLYFPSHYDIKYLVQGKEQCKGGLNKLASYLDIYRTGEVHQAGSDSMVTAEIFFSLINHHILSMETIKHSQNVIYGLGQGEDNNETILYTQFENPIQNNTKNEYDQKASSNANSYQNGSYSQYSPNVINQSQPVYYQYINYPSNKGVNPYIMNSMGSGVSQAGSMLRNYHIG